MIDKKKLEESRSKRNKLRKDLSNLINGNISSTTYEGHDYSESDIGDFIVENIEELSKIINNYMKP